MAKTMAGQLSVRMDPHMRTWIDGEVKQRAGCTAGDIVRECIQNAIDGGALKVALNRLSGEIRDLVEEGQYKLEKLESITQACVERDETVKEFMEAQTKLLEKVFEI